MRRGAVVAALAFSLGGSAASRIQHIGQIESLCLPAARAVDAGARAGALIVARGRGGGPVRVAHRARPRSGGADRDLHAGAAMCCGTGSMGRAAARLGASIKPLVAGAVVGAWSSPMPVLLTELLAQISNRPEIAFASRSRGSLHPASLMMLAFADVFGASDSESRVLGPAELSLARHVRRDRPVPCRRTPARLYAGALRGRGVARLWHGARRAMGARNPLLHGRGRW